MTCQAPPRLISTSTISPAWDGVTCPLSTIFFATVVERADEASATSAVTFCVMVWLRPPFEVAYHSWSVTTVPRFSVKVYLPELSAAVVENWWKLDWLASFRHSATWAPEAAVPEITTFWPARDGLGDAVMVGPETHGGDAQQVPDVAGCGQHVVVQQGVVPQHWAVFWQQIGWACG